PLRLECPGVTLTPGDVLYPYWGAHGYHRPRFDVYAAGPGGLVYWVPAHVDTSSDFVVLRSVVAQRLGLRLPFPRQGRISGVGGPQAATFSFPPDGLVSLFMTDYREYVYLPRPLVGFHAPSPAPSSQRSVLGLTGFLQFFRLIHDPEYSPPTVELHPITAF